MGNYMRSAEVRIAKESTVQEDRMRNGKRTEISTLGRGDLTTREMLEKIQGIMNETEPVTGYLTERTGEGYRRGT